MLKVVTAAAAAGVLTVAVLAAVPSGAQTADGPVVFACVHSGTFNRVHLDTPRPCSSGDAAVSWQGLPSAAPSPSPSPDPSPSASLSPGPSPSPSATGAWNCTASGAMGQCGPYAYPGVTGSVGGADCPQDGASCVGQDVWNPVPGWSQFIQVNSPGDWQVTANIPAGDGAVVSYPNAYAYYDRALPGFGQLTSTFSETTPHAAGTVAEASYDIWFDNPAGLANEVMIQTDFTGRDANCGGNPWAATGVQFGGTGGVPVHNWDLCAGGGTMWWESADGNIPSGGADLLGMLDWLVSHGYLNASASLHSVSFGWEINSTGGQPETFTVSSYTLSSS